MFQVIFLESRVPKNGGHFPLELTETFPSRSFTDKWYTIAYARLLEASLVKVLGSAFPLPCIDKIHFSQAGDYSKLTIPVD